MGSVAFSWQQFPCKMSLNITKSLQWRHNGDDSISNHQPHDCLLNRLFRGRSKKTSKPRVTGLCVGNSPGTGEFPAQMGSNAENVSIWWRHHVIAASPVNTLKARQTATFYRRNLHMHFLVWKLSYLVLKFIKIWSQGPNEKFVRIDSNNGLSLVRCKSIICTTDGLV